MPEIFRSADWEYGVNLYSEGDPCYDPISGEAYGSFTGTYTEYLQTTRPPGFDHPYFTTSSTNWMFRAWEPTGVMISTAPTAAGGFCVSTAPIGFPGAITRMPDSCTIAEAMMEVTCPFLHYHKQTITHHLDGSPDDIVDEYDSSELSYVVLALLFDGSYEFVCSFPTSGESHDEPRTRVVDCTELMQAIYARRHDVRTREFHIMVGFADLSGDIIESLRYPNPYEMVIPEGDACPVPFASVIMQETWDWGNPSIGQLWIKCDFGALTQYDTITERWPVGRS